MRILQICQRPQRRGAEVFAHQLTSELRRRGHDVAIVYLYPYEGAGSLPVSSEDQRLEGDEHHRLETLIGFRPALLRQLAEVIRDFGPDVTQLNGARAVKYGVLSRRILGAPVGSLVYRNIGVPQDWIQGPRRKAFYRLITRQIDGVAAITRGSLEALRVLFPEPTPLTVISNAVDPTALRPVLGRDALRRRASTPEGAPVVLFVGALSAEKRVGRLIDAVGRARERVPDLHLWIVGGGPLREPLEALVGERGLASAVRFFGVQDDVASFYAAADLLALVSETEGIPGVLLEAGLLGLPVVATKVGGVPECVVDGETGLLVDREDEDELVDALVRLAKDPALRARMGERARTRVEEQHAIARLAGDFLDFYRGVGDSASGGPPFTGRGGSGFAPETRLLLLVARPGLDAAAAEGVRELLGRDLDWRRLFAAAHRHKLAPLLAHHLRSFGSMLPDDVYEALGRMEFVGSCQVLEQTGQLVEVLAALGEGGIVAVPYKGPALGAQLYGSGALRPSGDLDVVVRPGDVLQARRLLAEAGYRPEIPLDEDERVSFMLRNRYHERLEREDGTRVELHWAFSNRDFPFALDLDEVFARLQTVEVGGHAVPAFHPDDLLLILSVHGAKHRWDRLEWLAAIAELLRRAADPDADLDWDLDWNAVISRASELGILRTLLLSLGLAHELLGAPVPEYLLARVRGDRAVSSLAAEVVELHERDPAGWEVPDVLQRDRFRLRLRERWRDRGRFIWHRSLTPSDPEEWRVGRVGDVLVPYHGLLRPVHVLGQLLGAVRALVPRSR